MQGPNYTIDYIVPEDKTLETQGIKLSGGVAAGMSMEFLVNGTYYNPLFYTANIPLETD